MSAAIRTRRERGRVQQAFSLSPHSLTSRIVSGAGFKLTGTVTRTVLTLVSTAVLARLLLPAEYGYIAMATIVTELAALFATAGITDTLVQRRRVARIQLDTAFWTLLAIGTGLGGIVALASLGTYALFGDTQVGPYMLALGLLFPVNSLAAIPSVLLTRLMDFRTEFHIGNASLLLRAIAAIGAASLGLGAWSLVIGAFTGSLVTLALTFTAYPFVPRLRFSTDYLVSSWRVSSLYLGGGLVYYVNMNADLLLVGRYWGAGSLGLYQNARALADELRARLAAPLAQTLFPAFSSVNSDEARMTDLFMRASRVLSGSILLLGGILSATAHEVVELLYGPRWQAMGPPLAVFALSAALRGATALASPLLNASNRPGLVLKHHLIGTTLMLFCALAVLPSGINAVAAAVALCGLYSLVPYAVAALAFDVKVSAIVKIMAGPALGALSCTAAAAAVRAYLDPWSLPAYGRFIVLVVLSVSLYVAVLTLMARDHVKELVLLVTRVVHLRG